MAAKLLSGRVCDIRDVFTLALGEVLRWNPDDDGQVSQLAESPLIFAI